jgi:hypothetical protein
MNRINNVAATLLLMSVAGGAFAQGQLAGSFHVYWPGSLAGGAGGGGIFNTQLLTGAASASHAGAQVAQYSSCVEINQYIAGGNDFDVRVFSLTNMSNSELAQGMGTYGKPLDGGTLHLVSNANRGAIAYLMATYMPLYSISGTAAQANALQEAVWYLWGFNDSYTNSNLNAGFTDPGTWGGASSTYNGVEAWGKDAFDLVKIAQQHNGYKNANVLWAHSPLAGNGDAGSWYQDQVFVKSEGFTVQTVPEASSLLLLTPGLIPLGIALRRRTRKS